MAESFWVTDFLALSPVFLALVLALLFKNIVFALFSAIALSGILLRGPDPISGIFYAVKGLLVHSLADTDHVQILIFSILVAALIGILRKSESTLALVALLSRYAKSKVSAQVLTWFSGMVVFFDDYANCLIVGSAMQPMAKKRGISKEKLAYIVDSTAAPVASISLVSTWVAFQVGLFEDAFKQASISQDAYSFYVAGIPYNFYVFLTMFFVGMIALSGRDFGPMRKAEEREAEIHRGMAQNIVDKEEELEGASPYLVWVFLTSIALLVGLTLAYMYMNGLSKVPEGAAFFEILGESDSYGAMIFGSLFALCFAFSALVLKKHMSLDDSVSAMIFGMKELFEPMLILVMAWTLSYGLGELGASAVLVKLLAGNVPVFLLPTLVFVVSGACAFATGTSFGTMGLLVPLVIPLAFSMTADPAILLASATSVLGGAVFGDHCSPISDTTIMSSMGSGCDHLKHVKTQLPYALTTGVVAILFGTLPLGMGVPLWVCMLSGCSVCFIVVYVFGKKESYGLGELVSQKS